MKITGTIVSPSQYILCTGRCPSCDKPLHHDDVAMTRQHRHCMVFLPEDWAESLRIYKSFKTKHGRDTSK